MSVYECAKENIMMNENLSKKIIPLNIGAGNSNEEMVLAFNEDRSDCTSMMYPSDAFTNDGTKVKIHRATDIFTSVLSKNPNAFLCVKINAEGAEYSIVSDLVESGMLDNVKVFIMDTHFDREDEIKK